MKFTARFLLLNLIAITFVFLLGCKGKEESDVIVEVEENKPEIIYQVYFVNVDNLRVRQAPNLESTVLDKIREGSLVYSKNEYSDRQETITLRGKKTTAPYFFVTGDGFQEGWVYGGALVKIYQNNTPSPFTTRLQEVIASLKNLKYSDMQSGKKLFMKVREYKGSDPVWNDALFVISKHFFDQLPKVVLFDEDQQKSFSSDDYRSIFEGRYNMNTTAYTSGLEQNGYKLEASEGEIYAIRNEVGLNKIISGPYSVPMRAHLDIKEKFENSRISEDGGLIINLKSLVDMVILEENFSQSYPDFIFVNEHIETNKSLQFILMNGMNNTPVRSYDTKEINSAFIEAWEYARKSYPDSKLVDELNKNSSTN